MSPLTSVLSLPFHMIGSLSSVCLSFCGFPSRCPRVLHFFRQRVSLGVDTCAAAPFNVATSCRVKSEAFTTMSRILIWINS
jgi:hypothetical protein